MTDSRKEQLNALVDNLIFKANAAVTRMKQSEAKVYVNVLGEICGSVERVTCKVVDNVDKIAVLLEKWHDNSML